MIFGAYERSIGYSIEKVASDASTPPILCVRQGYSCGRHRARLTPPIAMSGKALAVVAAGKALVLRRQLASQLPPPCFSLAGIGRRVPTLANSDGRNASWESSASAATRRSTYRMPQRTIRMLFANRLCPQPDYREAETVAQYGQARVVPCWKGGASLTPISTGQEHWTEAVSSESNPFRLACKQCWQSRLMWNDLPKNCY